MKLLSGLVITSFVAAAAPTPLLTGLYSVGELGLVEFSTVDGKVTGKVRSSEQCVFAPDAVVVQGVLEGSTFTGTVVLCQDDTSPSCQATRTYPMLGVFHDDAVAGYVRLDGSCRSPALDGKALHIRPANAEQRARVSTETSAAALAQKLSKADLQQLATETLHEANRLLEDQKVAPAREKFRQAMELDETRWESFLGYGVTEVKLKHAAQALPYFDKALALAQARRVSTGQQSQVHYNRACAYVQLGRHAEAVTSLRTAVKLGGAPAFVDALQTDVDLEPLRSDPDFRRLAADVQLQSRRRNK